MSTSVMMTSSSSSSFDGNLKKRIRDTTRLLNRPNLPADMRREMERKLAALQGALAEKGKHELEREMAIKYRMVKFFERKKAMRKLASAQASGNDEAVKAAQLDLTYILHFPKDRKYISLYPKEASSEAVVAQREAIRKEIAEKLALLGAETMLAKVLKAKAADLQDSADEDEDDDEDDDDEEDFDSEDDEESNDEDEDSELDDDEDDDDEDEDDDDVLDSDEDDDEDGSDLEGDFDSEDDDEEDEDFDSEDDDEDEDDDESDDDEDDFDSEDDEDDFDSEEEDSEEDEEESEEESENDGPSNKKSRRN